MRDCERNYEIDDELFDRLVGGFTSESTLKEDDVNYADNPKLLMLFLTILKPLLCEFIGVDIELIIF